MPRPLATSAPSLSYTEASAVEYWLPQNRALEGPNEAAGDAADCKRATESQGEQSIDGCTLLPSPLACGDKVLQPVVPADLRELSIAVAGAA